MKPTLADLQKQLDLCDQRTENRRQVLLATGREPERVEQLLKPLFRIRRLIVREIEKLTGPATSSAG